MTKQSSLCISLSTKFGRACSVQDSARGFDFEALSCAEEWDPALSSQIFFDKIKPEQPIKTWHIHILKVNIKLSFAHPRLRRLCMSKHVGIVDVSYRCSLE